MSCDSSCSGHGTCLTIENIYDFYTVGDDGNYDKWDAKQVTGCICEMGYTGANCDMRKSRAFTLEYIANLINM